MSLDFGFAKIFAAILETYFCHKGIWIAVIDYHMYFYIIALSPLTAIFHLRKFTAS